MYVKDTACCVFGFQENFKTAKRTVKQKTVLITGATGFLGGYVARELLELGFRLKLLVGKAKTGAGERFSAIFPAGQAGKYKINTLGSRVEIIEGDASSLYLGLSALRYFELAETVDEVFHCAETNEFRKGDALARLNVSGTALISLFCITKKIKRLHYISTAYVSGKSRGAVMEENLGHDQTFNNDYERSKCEAEQYLAIFASQYRVPCTIYRPGIITGDTVTGYTKHCDNIYLFLRELNRLKTRGASDVNPFMSPLRIPGDKYSTLNLVPVDYVARAVAAIAAQEKSIGKTFHIVNPSPPTLGELAVWVMAATGNNRIRLTSLHEFRMQPQSPEEQRLLRRIAVCQPYMFGEASFDSTNTRRLLSGTGIECPIITDDLIDRFNHYLVAMNRGENERLAEIAGGYEYYHTSLDEIVT